MLPIDGSAVILTVLAQLEASGIRSAMVITGYLGGLLRDFLGERYAGPIELTYAHQPEQLGSGHALKCALIAGMPRSATVVIASDTVWKNEDVLGLIESARADSDSLVTMGLQRWPVSRLPHHKQTTIDDLGRVRQVVSPYESESGSDASGDPAEPTALCGSPLYVFAESFWSDVAATVPSSHGLIELASTLQSVIDRGQTVRGYEVAQSRDITRPDDLLRYNFSYLSEFIPPLPIGR
jgi:NDP-sugar pyrophosphorylase family protein